MFERYKNIIIIIIIHTKHSFPVNPQEMYLAPAASMSHPGRPPSAGSLLYSNTLTAALSSASGSSVLSLWFLLLSSACGSSSCPQPLVPPPVLSLLSLLFSASGSSSCLQSLVPPPVPSLLFLPLSSASPYYPPRPARIRSRSPHPVLLQPASISCDLLFSIIQLSLLFFG